MFVVSYDIQRTKKTTTRGGERIRHARPDSAILRQQGLDQTHGLNPQPRYLLYSEGKIDSVCIRRPGSTRGKRLWHIPSVMAFLESCREVAR